MLVNGQPLPATRRVSDTQFTPYPECHNEMSRPRLELYCHPAAEPIKAWLAVEIRQLWFQSSV